MAKKFYLLKEEGKKMLYSPALVMDNPNLNVLDHEIRQKIVEELSKEPMFAAELARKLSMHEQKIYYHIKQLVNTGILEEVEKVEIRGTVAKKYKPKYLNFAYSMEKKWKELDGLSEEQDSKLKQFLAPFIEEGNLNADIVVGSPDPHGPYKSYARDGHYAIDLALFLGRYCNLPDNFTVKLDVDVKAEKTEDRNLIIVGGPGTNLLTQEINNFLPIKFDIKEAEDGFMCSGIVSEKTGRRVTGEKTGLMARIPNPHNPEKYILMFAGFRCIGSKTGIMGLTRYPDLILQKFDPSIPKFAAITDAFDLDGDGKIDSVELVE